jgi:hypothetical protein
MSNEPKGTQERALRAYLVLFFTAESPGIIFGETWRPSATQSPY